MNILKMKLIAGVPITRQDRSYVAEVSMPATAIGSSEVIVCPFCECNLNKPEFYDHVMLNHNDKTCSMNKAEANDDEIVIDFGGGNPNQTLESVEDATVWDKTVDKNENDKAIDDDKISLPAAIKKQLNDEIAKLVKYSDELLKTDYDSAVFYNNVANVMIEILDHLEEENEHCMKMAQICLTKQPSNIVQKIPNDVYAFIINGGFDEKEKTTNSLTTILKR